MPVLREAWRFAAGQRFVSVLLVVLTACMALSIIATSGRELDQERTVLANVESPIAREIAVSDVTGEAGLTADDVDRISRLAGVRWVIGLTQARDVAVDETFASSVAPMRHLVGRLPPELLNDALEARPGTAVVGEGASRILATPSGVATLYTEDGASVNAVGLMWPEAPLDDLGDSVILVGSGAEQLQTVRVMAAHLADVGPLRDAIAGLLMSRPTSAVRIESSAELAEIHRAIRGDLGSAARRLVAATGLFGGAMIFLTTLIQIRLRQRDLARRRALGASRTFLVALVMTQSGLLAAAGAFVGAAVGVATSTVHDGGILFGARVCVLTFLCAVIASVGPAVRAAAADPVRLLRVP